MNIKQPSAAGKFYTKNKIELENQLEYFDKNSKPDCDYKTRAIIVPHAGYEFSGKLAAKGFQYFDKNIKNIFVIAPPHYVGIKDVSISNYDIFSTPLGNLEVNKDITYQLLSDFECNLQNEAFEDEHSIEVQLPFVQKFTPDKKIIPILGVNVLKLKKIIEHFWSNPENGFVISSDLSHFYSSKDAKKIDEDTANYIESNSYDKFSAGRACGAAGVIALMMFAESKKYSLIRLGMYNSSDITGDETRVVGYGSWLLYEGSKNQFIKNYYSSYTIDICKKSIQAQLKNENLRLENIPAVFGQTGASFITLEKSNDLRGCIGTIIAHRPLIEDIAQNAQNSAFSDPRFPPLQKEELNELSINVSLLSTPEKITFDGEEDLLKKIRQNIDGIIINDKGKQAVYLPSVWGQLPDKGLFLKSLKIKAGMDPDYFSPTFEAYKFTTEYIKSD